MNPVDRAENAHSSAGKEKSGELNKRIIVDVDSQWTRVALLEDHELAEVYFEMKGSERIVGNIYLGKVQNVLPGMQAAFVDIGQERNAFLYAGDILSDKSDLEFSDQPGRPEIPARIQDMVKPGQAILLQVLKEPVGNKGARVTAHITLPGRNLVLMPTVDYIGVSRRIEDEEERTRLRNIIESCKPEGMGVILRTVAEGKNESEFVGEMKYLLALWQDCQKAAAKAAPPALVHAEEKLLYRIIRDMFTGDVQEVVVNDQKSWESLSRSAKVFSPEYAGRVHLYQGEESPFEEYGLDSKVDKLLGRRIWLKSGGYIIIDQMEALTAIDVNTGKYVGTDDLQKTLRVTNMEAAAEIARQLRLRDIGGIIIIDFIDMEDPQSRVDLLEALQEYLKKDRTKSNVVGMTGLGLVEMTRKKVRKSLSDTLQMDCPHCHGEGKVFSELSMALKIRQKLGRFFLASSCEDWLVELHPSVAKLLQEREEKGRPVFDNGPGRNVYLKSRPDWNSERYEITPLADPKDLQRAQKNAQLLVSEPGK